MNINIIHIKIVKKNNKYTIFAHIFIAGNLDEVILFCHGKNNRMGKGDGTRGKNYLKLRCDAKDRFLSDANQEVVKAEKVYCVKKVDPEIVKMPGKKARCANVGADERKDDLQGYINTYQIGWNMKSLQKIGVKKGYAELVSY